jgi:hypothetical protein
VSRGGNITIGVVLIVVGLGITAASYSSASAGGGKYVVAWGAVLVGVIRLIRGLAAPEAHRPLDGESFAQSLGRTGPSEGAQVAGRPCVHCHEKIISVADGELCTKCQSPVHGDCRGAHRRDAHGKGRAVAEG